MSASRLHSQATGAGQPAPGASWEEGTADAAYGRHRDRAVGNWAGGCRVEAS